MSAQEVVIEKEKLMVKLEKYMRMMLELRECRDHIQQDLDRVSEEVEKPITNYELCENGGIGYISWRGKNADKAEDDNRVLKNGTFQYEDETACLLGQIDHAIDLLSKKIKKIKKQLAAL